jgi:hypothetical protein
MIAKEIGSITLKWMLGRWIVRIRGGGNWLRIMSSGVL